MSGGDAADRAEQRRLAMAYRHTPEFATGHGAAVHVTPAQGDPMRAVEVRTEAVPSYEIPFTDVPAADADSDLPGLADLILDMRDLAEVSDDDLGTGLTPLVTAYRDRIDGQEVTLAVPERHLDGYADDAKAAIAAARRAAMRIEAGIELIKTDGRARQAFRFANRAMHLQRVHIIAAEARQKDKHLTLEAAVAAVDIRENRSWRPFQLAFLLLNLPSLTDPAHPEHAAGNTAVADLLWFPTGGGKTEAYLGLTAYTLAIRRLQQGLGGLSSADGVAVLMRYTLRLLTIQQFQRAAALICAAEVIRRADPQTWNTTPFRIGLWVGSRVTPNRTSDAADWLKQQRGAKGTPSRALGSPHQLTACPWCGAGLEAGRDIAVDLVSRRTLVTCPDPFCEFGMNLLHDEGLPVVVVDEEIYRLLPSLVIGTVDKFAQLTWRGETQALFGRVSRRCARHGYVTDDLMAADWELNTDTSQHPAKNHYPVARMEHVPPLRPPDLIIQDELHLISGPLGSLAGLYEAAVDRLATCEISPNGSGLLSSARQSAPVMVRPKVIASSATVRRAPRQIGALFDRHTEVFPPPGIDVGDNFFARQRPPESRPGRRYVGICAHGTRMRSVLIRVYVSVLGAAQKVHEKYGKNPITDPYMTLVGYFNSLRDLGGMRRLVEDDVSARLTCAEDRGLARRYDPLLKELTSRLSSTEIPGILGQLSVAFPRLPGPGSVPPIDVLLATNMIAVGVDVSRLGVMVVASQPKSTAEYVQATSRVGRAAPGLVFTVFNWARPSDLSHYESFEHFHATFYRHVEALSVTPFADRAIDRGTAVVGALDKRLDQWDKERRVPGRRLSYDTPGTADDVAPLLRRIKASALRAAAHAPDVRPCRADPARHRGLVAVCPVENRMPALLRVSRAWQTSPVTALDDSTRRALVRRGFALEWATLGWNVAGIVILAFAAVTARSVALAGFGLDSLTEIGASTVVIWELSGTGADRQRRGLQLIGYTFAALAVYLLVQSTVVLATGYHPRHSAVGIVWTAVTAAVMFTLAAGKARTGRTLGNPVLQTEGRVTVIDGILAVAVLLGLILNAAAGWWWADPAAGYVLVYYATREVREIFTEDC